MDNFEGNEGNHPFSHVPVDIIVSVGRARPKVCDLLQLEPNAILQLDRRVGDPVELFVGDRLIARGELEESSADATGLLAVRLTEVAKLDSGL